MLQHLSSSSSLGSGSGKKPNKKKKYTMENIASVCKELSEKLKYDTHSDTVDGAKIFTSHDAIDGLVACLESMPPFEDETCESRRVRAVMVFNIIVTKNFADQLRRGSLGINHKADKKNIKIDKKTFFRLVTTKFSPYLLHCVVVGLKGLGEEANAQSYFEFNGLQSSSVSMRDEDDSPENAVYVPVSDEYQIFGFDPSKLNSTDLKVHVEWNSDDGSSAGTAAATIHLKMDLKMEIAAAHHLETGFKVVELSTADEASCFERKAGDMLECPYATWFPTAKGATNRGSTPKTVVQIACYVTKRKEMNTFVHDERDSSKQNWRIYTRIDKVEGAKSHVPIIIPSHVRIEVATKLAGKEAATSLVPKDPTTLGASFNNQRLCNIGLVERQYANHKIILFERLKSDVTRVRRLGTVSVPLNDIPIVMQHGPKHEPKMKRYEIRRRGITGADHENGSLTCSVWMMPLLVGQLSRPYLLYFGILAFVGTYFWTFVVCRWLFSSTFVAFLLTLPFVLGWLALELPQLIGKLLTCILDAAVPGLGLSFGAIRLFFWFSDIDDPERLTAPQDIAAAAENATRRLTLRIEVDNFAIGNPKQGVAEVYTHCNFVSACKVRLAISIDKRLVNGILKRAYAVSNYGWRKYREELEVGEECPKFANWSPFPSVQHQIRKDLYFESTRLGSIRFDEIRVDDCAINFDMGTHGEFNINHFVRALADGKVKMALKKNECPPNTLEVTVVKATGFSTKASPKVVMSVRDATQSTSTWSKTSGSAAWNQTFRFACPDPSAVVHVALQDDSSMMMGSLVGQWVMTAKMLVVAPDNIWAEDDLSIGKQNFDAGYSVRANMILRDASYHTVPNTRLELELRYFYDPATPSVEDLNKEKPTTALQQLQMNSLELNRRMGSVRWVQNMLEDFPLLFDVRGFEVDKINFYLKDLFSGYAGAEAEAHPHKLLFGGRRQEVRSKTGAKKDNIFVEKLDLRFHLQPSPDLPEGIDLWLLSKALVVNAIKPVLSEVDLTAAIGHIMSGVFSGVAPNKPPSLNTLTKDVTNVASSVVLGAATATYAFKERVQRKLESGAQKYVGESDAEALLKKATFVGDLDKAAYRPSSFSSSYGMGHTSYYKRNRCEIHDQEDSFVLFYTKRNTKSGGFTGAQKKITLSKGRFDGVKISLQGKIQPASLSTPQDSSSFTDSSSLVLSTTPSSVSEFGSEAGDPRGHKKEIQLRASKQKAGDPPQPTIEDWWKIIAGDEVGVTDGWLDLRKPPSDAADLDDGEADFGDGGLDVALRETDSLAKLRGISS